MIEGAVVAILNASADVSNLVGSNIYVTRAPQFAKMPYVILQQISTQMFPTFDNRTGDLRFADVDVECYDTNSIDSATLSKAVRETLQDYVGSIGGVDIQATLYDGDERHGDDRPNDGSDIARHVYSTSFNFQFTED